ncbi:hypothetical protein NKI34_35100 [Mesorhizobium sp. M0700]
MKEALRGHQPNSARWRRIALMVQQTLKRDPHSGRLFCFRSGVGETR